MADQLATASPDLLRSLLSTFIAALMGAEADALCGAGYGERSSAMRGKVGLGLLRVGVLQVESTPTR